MQQHTHTHFDVVVIGGGPAALSTALVLGRMRFSVLVIDAGEPRNRFSSAMHGFLGSDGANPLTFLSEARAQLRQYGVQLRSGSVEAIHGHLGSFTVEADIASFSASRVVVATGLVDRLPALGGIQELWGTHVFHCPFCHGWELRDRNVGIVAWHPLALHQVDMMARLTAAIDVLPLGITLDAETAGRFSARSIAVRDVEPTSLKLSDDGRVSVVGARGDVLHYDAVMCGGWPEPNDSLLRAMGCALSKTEMPLGNGFVEVSSTGETSVPGLYAAGNVVNPNAQVIAAAAQGSVVAAGIVQATLLHG